MVEEESKKVVELPCEPTTVAPAPMVESSVKEEKTVIPPPPPADDKCKALAVVDKTPELTQEKPSGGSQDIDIVLARVETEKRLSLLKAWEENEITKVENKMVDHVQGLQPISFTSRFIYLRHEIVALGVMAIYVDPHNGNGPRGKHCYSMWQTLFEIDTKYVPIKPIGRGAYGIVCSSVNRETNEKVAIKKIHNAFENRIDALRTLREIKLLRHLRHDNVIALNDVMMPIHRRSFKDVYLVYELMDTDLHQIIKSSQALSNDHCQYFLFQLLRGLKYLHSANILHRDLKPGNLLVNANCDLKICDFGLARTSSGKGQFMTEYVVTRWYRAPELLLCCDNYGTSIDVWSVGCIFAELLGRKPIFPGTECLNQLKLIINVLGSQSEADLEFIDNPKARKYIKTLPYSPTTPLGRLYPHANPLAIDLLQLMLIFDPTKRISVTEALQHPYMAPLYDSNSNPPAQVPIDLDIDEDLGEEMIREMMWNEMLQYHPEASSANAS
ncbi:hypothetical protein GIB67_004881 [Kingdonia uniflora]|uniref:Mitogen-activated protein kinase n=1 Tax=Kingdonia uniflora TaxID=39325 RepID=A0A7J7LNT4_9MAGN|nr:hypothetical protein GIB67_004881 [Kingdonia uniflora]